MGDELRPYWAPGDLVDTLLTICRMKALTKNEDVKDKDVEVYQVRQKMKT